jgi:hypothetical protein
VIAIYEKRRAEHEKKVTELEKKQKAVAPAPALAPAPLKKGLTPKKANIV